MKIQTNYSLKTHHTFGFNIKAKLFARLKNLSDLKKIDLNQKILILGGGSNLVFTKDFDGLVLQNSLSYIKIKKDTPQSVTVEFGSGVCWDKVCAWATRNKLYGIENLSGIPGTIGAAPIQNIGAYGQELKDSFYKLSYFDLKTKKIHILTKKDCHFGYRDSVFKSTLKSHAYIVSVTLRLSKIKKLNLNYPDLVSAFGNKQPTLSKLRKTILAIRASKLPDWKQQGNAGSFFKNPIISQDHYQSLSKSYPDLKSYPDPHGVKINAGYLIEKSGFKGYKLNQVGVSDKHALILVNHGDGDPQDLLTLVQKIIDTVYSNFTITLVPEVNFY